MTQARRIDQDPRRNQYANNIEPITQPLRIQRGPSPAHQPSPRGYTETPLSRAPIRPVPSHIPRDVVADPNNAAAREVVPGANRDRAKIPSWQKWGAGVLGALTLGGVLYGIGSTGDNKNSAPNAPVDQSSASYDPADTNHDGVVSQLEQMSSDGIVTKDELESLSDPTQSEFVSSIDLTTAYAKDFDNWRQDTYSILDNKGYLNEAQKDLLKEMPNTALPKSEWPDQMVSNAIGLDVADADIQDTEGLGVLMMPTVLAPKAPLFQEARDNVKEKIATINLYKIAQSFKPKNNEFLGNTELSSNARIMIGDMATNSSYDHNTYDDTHIGVLVDLSVGHNGEEMWRELDSWDANSTQFLSAIQDLQQ